MSHKQHRRSAYVSTAGKEISRVPENRKPRESESHLFVNRNGNLYSVGKVTEYGLWPVQDKLGIPHTGTHAFRHAAASELLEEGAPLLLCKANCVMVTRKTTLQKYGHVVGDSQRRAVNTLAEKIERQVVELESSAEIRVNRRLSVLSSAFLERAMGIEQIQSAKTKALLPAFQFNWSQMESSSGDRYLAKVYSVGGADAVVTITRARTDAPRCQYWLA